MPVRRPVAESTVVQMLLIDTFTHSGFYPAVSERSLSTAVSVEYWNSSLPVVKTGDFEFDTDLLISLLEVRPVLWDKTDHIYRQKRNEKGMDRSLYLSSRRLQSSRRCSKNTFGEYCHNLLNTAVWNSYTDFFLFYFMCSAVHIFDICKEAAPASVRQQPATLFFILFAVHPPRTDCPSGTSSRPVTVKASSKLQPPLS